MYLSNTTIIPNADDDGHALKANQMLSPINQIERIEESGAVRKKMPLR